MKNKKVLILLFLIGLAVLFQILFRQQIFWIHVMTLIYLTMILSASLRLMTLTGLLNLSAIAFMRIGAYSSALLSTRLEIFFWLAMPIAGALCSFMSIFLGFPLLRLIGTYFFDRHRHHRHDYEGFFREFFCRIFGRNSWFFADCQTESFFYRDRFRFFFQSHFLLSCFGLNDYQSFNYV